MLPKTHVLSELKPEDGFQIRTKTNDFANSVELLFGKIQADLIRNPTSNLRPLRDVIPFTEGRAIGWKLAEQVRAAKARNWPHWKPFEFHKQAIAICGGGPSLGWTLHELRTLAKAGVKVMAVNRTHDFLIDLPKTHGINWIKPWAGIMLEAIPHAANYMRPTNGVRYYIGSQCHPTTFDKFEKSEHYIWHAQSRMEMINELTPEEHQLMVPAIGSTCGLRAIMLAYMMGFTRIHLFGFDSCYSKRDIEYGIMGPTGAPKLHAYPKPEAVHDYKELVIKGFPDGDRTYFGNGNMLAQADEFIAFWNWRDDQIKTGKFDPHHIVVHGDGVIPDIARDMGVHIENYIERRMKAA